MTRTILTIALALGLCTGVDVTTATSAQATGVNSTGSILYVKNHDVYAITPNGAHVRRITHNGATATTNHTGGIGYLTPSASSNGKIVVAVRNQKYASGGYKQGWLHVMNRNGRALHTFKPAQFKYLPDQSLPCSAKVDELPLGIVDAMVSPDGRHIIYTAVTYVQSTTCQVYQGYSTWVVNANGTGAAMIKRGNGNGASLEAGQWVNNTRFLLDDVDFGSQGFWYVDLPGHRAHAWTQASSFTDGTWSVPALHKGKLASIGFSDVTSGNALRLWSSSGPPARPTRRCDLASPVGGSATPDRPSWSPNSDAVVYGVDDQNGAARAGEGIYVLKVATLSASSCQPAQLLVPGGEGSFWTPAALASS